MSKNNKFKSGFTLIEVIITMIVIAVVVGVTMKLSKSRLDNIKSYTYYAAFSTLDSVARVMTADYNKDDITYTDPSTNVENGNLDLQTLPRSGNNFCAKFRDTVNTIVAGNFQECSGSNIGANHTNFSGDTPDLVLRNGMRLYNVRRGPARITDLNNNSRYTAEPDNAKDTKYDINGGQVDIDEYGYTVYIDIDGSRSGNSVLWEDVYPFYITMRGNVFPAWDSAKGAAGKDYLITGVYYDDDSEGTHVNHWITKSASYRVSACISGLAKAETSYCNTAPAVSLDNHCGEGEGRHNCLIQIVTPLKLFN